MADGAALGAQERATARPVAGGAAATLWPLEAVGATLGALERTTFVWPVAGGAAATSWPLAADKAALGAFDRSTLVRPVPCGVVATLWPLATDGATLGALLRTTLERPAPGDVAKGRLQKNSTASMSVALLSLDPMRSRTGRDS